MKKFIVFPALPRPGPAVIAGSGLEEETVVVASSRTSFSGMEETRVGLLHGTEIG